MTTQTIGNVMGVLAFLLLVSAAFEPLWAPWGTLTVLQLLLALGLSLVAARWRKWWLVVSGLCFVVLGVIAAGVLV